MSNTAVLSSSASGVSETAMSREQQPKAVLTPKQKLDIERTWKEVEDNGLMEPGIMLFQHIFTIFPPAQKMFKSFAEVPFEQLPENDDFRAHALQVTETISLAVSTLDDMETLQMVLKDLGAAHGTQGLQEAHFDIVGKALMMTLEAWLGDGFTPAVKEAYAAFYGVVITYMKEGLA